MLFSSPEFLFLFLPLTVLIYFLVPCKWRNIALLIVSLLFYGWGEPIYVFLMIGTIIADYIFGYFVGKFNDDKSKAKKVLLGSVIFNLSILAFFKYADFFIENLARIPFLSFLSPLGIALPIGISFYTFQALSYVIDVYRGEAKVQKNIINFGTYVTLFPQLIAGPIVRYHDIDKQLSEREHSVSLAASGMRTFVVGLAKKLLIANAAGELWERFSTLPMDERTVVGAWFGLLCYTLHIYFDFSGYSDMAIGLGKIFGFRFLENFNYPYISKSITDFWRRWHISLSTWFREYLYIPLGGNRKGVGRTILNLLVVWFLTGFWHGADWNFIIWGLYYFVLLVIEKQFLGKYLDKIPKAFSHIYSLFFIMIGWLIFATNNTAEGLLYLKSLFGISVPAFATGADVYEILRNTVLVVIALIGSTPYPKQKFYSLCERKSCYFTVANIATVLLLVICTAYMINSSYNPFLYFRF